MDFGINDIETMESHMNKNENKFNSQTTHKKKIQMYEISIYKTVKPYKY